MKVIPSIKKFTLNLNEKSVVLNINEDFNVEYIMTNNSNNIILQDLVEAKAYATTLLYLNENYNLNVNHKLFENNKVEDYYNDCNELLKENTEIVEEKGILLTSINGYNIYESQNGILRGNGLKKIKESFDEESKSIGVVNSHVEDMGGHTMAVFGKLSDGTFFAGNEELLSIYDEDIWPQYLEDDPDTTDWEKEHQIETIYPDDGIASDEDIKKYYDIISQTKFFNDEDLEWFKEKLGLTNLDEAENTKVDLESLASDLVDFGEEYDLYNFTDNYDSKEEAYEEIMKSFNSKSQIQDMIKFIQNVIDDSENDNHEREESLIARLENIIPTLNEDGTQVGDIATKVDQDMSNKKKNKKYYDILLSGIDESMDSIINKGFMKNINGQYERDNYILVKENNKFIAIRKDKLLESR